ncbi:MAG: ABC transporter ATP-binding protein, partial [Bacteroidota bacterium]
VSFAYETEEVLKKVDLSIPRGKKIAFVGPSGSGKSTALDLLIRFYDPVRGDIYMDGRNIRDFRIEDYRSLFGIVAQETMLFNDTVANNIRYGSESTTREEIEAAAKIANAYDFITKLPKGFDTPIGDRGIVLSGGERQRVAIARALVRNPRILIFDEATSALDAESEKVVQKAIHDSLENRTAVLVAHRLATIIDCDEIVVFERGRIVERGTHAELIARGGVYKMLYDIQFASEELGEDY